MIKWLFGGILVALIYQFLNANYVFRSIEPHGNDDCTLLKGPIGAEDAQVHNGVAYISSDDRRKWMGKSLLFDEHESLLKLPKDSQGAIFALDLNTQSPVPYRLPIKGLTEGVFHPHGISLAQVEGELLLTVICHSTNPDELRVFRVVFEGDVPKELQWLRTLRHPLISQNINDVHVRKVDGVMTFYVSVLGAAKQGTLTGVFELFTQRPWSYVAKCTEKLGQFECATFAPFLNLANGVNTSPDGKLVYVGVTQTGRVNIYSPEGLLLGALELASGVDNIDMDPTTGDLYVGCHPKLLDFVRHKGDPEVSSPSQVLRIRPCNASEPSHHQPHDSSPIYGQCQTLKSSPSQQPFHLVVDEVYLTKGHATPNSLSASAVGAFDPKTRSLVVGGVFDDGVVLCRNR